MFSPKLTSEVTRKFHIEGADALVSIKYLKPGVLQNITGASTKIISKQSEDGNMAAQIGFDMVRKNRDIVKACLVDWKGFKDDNDGPLKFNAINVGKMVDESVKFVEWVVECHDELTAEFETEEEVAQEN